MKKYTKDALEAAGYRIENMKITSADLSMQDHGCMSLYLTCEGGSIGFCYGGYCLGHGYLGAEEFEGSSAGMEYVMRIMDTVGVDKFSDLKGKYIRAAIKGWGDHVKIIGNIIEDKWFDSASFFLDKKEGE